MCATSCRPAICGFLIHELIEAMDLIRFDEAYSEEAAEGVQPAPDAEAVAVRVCGECALDAQAGAAGAGRFGISFFWRAGCDRTTRRSSAMFCGGMAKPSSSCLPRCWGGRGQAGMARGWDEWRLISTSASRPTPRRTACASRMRGRCDSGGERWKRKISDAGAGLGSEERRRRSGCGAL